MFGNFDRDKIIHFIGLGGIGMSGIAEILHSLGFVIQGSDKINSYNLERLAKIGIKTFIGHNKIQVKNADIVVYSSAIKQDNVELVYARELQIPCLSRADMLSQIVRFKQSIVVAGSHGKTTVTSLCATLLEIAGFQPTVINGGIINSYGSNAKLGQGDWAVIESDESDGSFIQIFPTIAIVTNIDREHLYYYGSFDNLKRAFKIFLSNLPFFGMGIVCIDDSGVQSIIRDIKDRKILTYGLTNLANVQAINIRKSNEGSIFNIKYNQHMIHDIYIPLFGDHNIRNALSIVALSIVLKVEVDIIKAMLASFSGVKRRFTTVGYINNVLVVDDYAHHPTEIRSLLIAAKQKKPGRLVVVHQPHRFRRLNQLFNEFCTCFDLADTIIIVPVYKADDIESAPLDSIDLYENIREKNKDAYYAEDKNKLKQILMNTAKQLNNNDIIIFTGAGDISQWAYEIVSSIK